MRLQVSILIPCHNAERWVAQAIESALAQTHPPKEILVVDDGSTDGSLGAIRQYASRVRLIEQPHSGGNIARNRLLAEASADWVQYLDADDYLLPDKLESQLASLAQSPDTDILYSPVIYERWSHESTQQEQQILPPLPHDPWSLLARWQLPQTGSPLWRKQAIEDVGGWKADQSCCQEHELYFRLLKAAKRFTFHAKSGAIYRQWSPETVCRKDEHHTRMVRLDLLQEVENYLESTDQLTAYRQHAINLTRFESIRMIWLRDPAGAREIDRLIQRREPGFRPEGRAAPPFYRIAYRLLGFSGAEKVAALKRRLVGNSTS